MFTFNWSGHLPYNIEVDPETTKVSWNHKVFKNQFEMVGNNPFESMKAVIQDSESKKLIFGIESILAPLQGRENSEIDKFYALQMDDSVDILGGIALQKDSEFLQLFDYYILKALETGVNKRLFNKHIDLNRKENFGINEPQSLGFSNVMFCFILLGFGCILSLLSQEFDL